MLCRSDYLGLDPEKFRQSVAAQQRAANAAEDDDDLLSGLAIDPAVKYRDVKPLHVTCRTCGTTAELRGIREDVDVDATSNDGESRLIKRPVSGLRCPKCQTSYGAQALGLYVRQWIRTCVAQYYDGWMQCDA